MWLVNLIRDISAATLLFFLVAAIMVVAALVYLSVPYIWLDRKQVKSKVESFISRIPVILMKIKSPILRILLVLIIAFLIVDGAICEWGRCTQIGSVFEAREYTETYYVMLSRNGTTYYKIPATIYHNDEVYRENKRVDSRYFIKSAYFSNGGSLYFGDVYDFEYSQISLTEPRNFEDQNCEVWQCVLTKERAK